MVDTVTAAEVDSSSCVAPLGPSVPAVAPVSVGPDSADPAPGGRGVEEGREAGPGAVTYGHRSSPC